MTSIAEAEFSFQTIIPGEILRDRLVFGIRDQQAQEKLLRNSRLTLAETDDVCRSHESTCTDTNEAV
jgi:hypothetical protein